MTPEPADVDVTVVVPAFDEAATIAEAIRRLDGELTRQRRPYEIVVVSDGSTDGTPEIAGSLGLPNLSVVHYPDNRGKGHAVKAGAAVARGRLVAFIDGDLDIHPRSLVRLLDQLEESGVDAVVASKVHPDSVVRYPAFRRLQSRCFRQLVRTVFALDVSDSQTGLKVFRAELLDKFLPEVHSSGFTFDLELLVLANDAGMRVTEGPVELDYQFSTTTGMSAVVTMLREVVAIHRRRRSTTTILSEENECSETLRRSPTDPPPPPAR